MNAGFNQPLTSGQGYDTKSAEFRGQNKIVKQPNQRGRSRPVAAGPEAPPDPLALVKRLIWLYFWLLIFEGVLRKWLLPSLSNPLLLIRDPVLVAIFAAAAWKKVFPSGFFITAIAALGALSFLAGLLVERPDVFVNAYGLHCNFLHLPLIYVIGRVFTLEDVKRMGRWVLILAVPMAGLMLAQFRADPGDFLNKGAGEEGWMLDGMGGHIRPSGTFTFVTGIICFYATVAAFLLNGLVEKKSCPLWLGTAAGLALPAALVVSVSRSAMASVAIVLAAYCAALLLRPQLLLKSTKLIVLGGMVVLLAGSFEFVQEGLETFYMRVAHAGEVEGGGEGFFLRFWDGLVGPLRVMMKVPLLGHGQGMGTNVGLKVRALTIEDWKEGEWERVLYESGAFLGLLFLMLRGAILWDLGLRALRAARAGSLLPLLLMAACGVNIFNGQFAQTTLLGFTVLVAGLALAALKSPQGAVPSALPPPPRSGRKIPERVRAQWAEARARMEAARSRPPVRPLPRPRP